MKYIHIVYRQPYDGTDAPWRETSDYVSDCETLTVDRLRQIFNLPSAEIKSIMARDTSGSHWAKIFPPEYPWQVPGEAVAVDMGSLEPMKYGRYVGPGPKPRTSLIQFPGRGAAEPIIDWRICLRQHAAMPDERGLSNTCY